MVFETICNEILQIIEDLKENSAAGFDDNSTIIIKKTRSLTCKHLVHLVNKPFNGCKFPRLLKQAKFVPLHKAGAKDEINNYRPISLLIVWSKVFEHVVYNRFYIYVETFNLFHPNINLVFEKKT